MCACEGGEEKGWKGKKDRYSAWGRFAELCVGGQARCDLRRQQQGGNGGRKEAIPLSSFFFSPPHTSPHSPLLLSRVERRPPPLSALARVFALGF